MKKFTYFLLAALFGLAVTGCDQKPEEIDQLDGSKQYISFRIASASNSAYTKASYGTDPNEYKHGETDEYDVKNVRFLFYKGETFKAVGKDVTFDWVAGEDDITSKTKEAKCVLEGLGAGEKPDKVLCFLNITNDLYDKFSSKTTPMTFTQVLEYVNAVAADSELNTFVMQDGKYYFTMSNSVHQNTDGSVANAVDVAAYIYDDEAQAIANPVTIYVERLAAKVEATRKNPALNTLGTATDPLIKDVTGGTDVSICEVEIVEGAWAINAVNRSAYLTKKIEDSATWSHTTYPWMGLNNDHRSFWEIDPNYTGLYTDYAKDAADYDANFDGKPADDYMLINYSTNDLLKHVGKKIKNYPTEIRVVDGDAVTAYDANNLRARFCLPNTMGQKSGVNVADYDADLVSHPKKVGTHLIVFAQVMDGANPVETFYVYSGNPCTEALYLKRALANINSSTYGKLYKDAAGTEPLAETDLKITKADFKTDTDGKDYIVEKPNTEWTDGYVSVFPKDGVKVYYKDASTTTVTEITAGSAAYKATFGKAVVERANKYNQGLMYYAIPIEHANTKLTTQKDPYGNEDRRYELGSYGVVRNHWYNITLGDVKGLGKGIDDPNEPIVPEEDMEWHLAAEIKINAWHVVNQTSDLK